MDRTRHRRSIRLAGYDYAGDGVYFVTILTYQRTCRFATIRDGEVILSGEGKRVSRCWEAIPAHFPQVSLDAFVVMPNHVHGIAVIEDAGLANAVEDVDATVRARHALPLRGADGVFGGRELAGERKPKPGKPIPGSLGAVVGSFKAAVTREINLFRGTEGSGVWHRNYFEKIIRNETMLNAVRQYILANPVRWKEDEFYSDEMQWR